MVAVVSGGFGGATADAGRRADSTATTTATTTATNSTQWQYKTLRKPDRVQVLDGSTNRPVAMFTLRARTVILRGPVRTFAEPASTTATVVSSTWVRLLPRPFTGTVDKAWLTNALADTSADLLAIAAQYRTGAPTVTSADGSVLSSDASYGPLLESGTRAEGSDFSDYLGVTWAYGQRSDAPEADQLGALDCSGFVRMVLGYRLGLPLTLEPDGTALPRRSFEQLQSAPGIVTVPDTGTRPASTDALAPGDLVFFDGSTDDGTRIDHVGIYLGKDTAGEPRFISSRKTVDGPTLGDVGGKSVLSGPGYYAAAWRAARRI